MTPADGHNNSLDPCDSGQPARDPFRGDMPSSCGASSSPSSSSSAGAILTCRRSPSSARNKAKSHAKAAPSALGLRAINETGNPVGLAGTSSQQAVSPRCSSASMTSIVNSPPENAPRQQYMPAEDKSASRDHSFNHQGTVRHIRDAQPHSEHSIYTVTPAVRPVSSAARRVMTASFFSMASAGGTTRVSLGVRAACGSAASAMRSARNRSTGSVAAR